MNNCHYGAAFESGNYHRFTGYINYNGIEGYVKDATFELNDKKWGIVFYDGRWVGGTWPHGHFWGGVWESGTWGYGYWHDGSWLDGIWKDGEWEKGIWHDGIWHNGIWRNGEWLGGKWQNGGWLNGTWHKGIWNFGRWNDGKWMGGFFKRGFDEYFFIHENESPETWISRNAVSLILQGELTNGEDSDRNKQTDGIHIEAQAGLVRPFY